MSELLGEVFVARQPLVDANLAVPAYEILYRDMHGQPPVGEADGTRATSRVLIDVLLGAQRSIIPDGVDAYVNVPASMFEAGLLLNLPSDGLVLEVLEDAEDTPQLRAALARHRAAGFGVVLDDIVPGDPRLGMLASVDAVKVDVLASGLQPALRLITELAGQGRVVVAEKVEDARTRRLVFEVGATLVQGFVFSEPELVSTVRPHGISPTHLQLLELIARDDVDFRFVDQLIRSNVALADRFLRLANITTDWREIRSVHEGLVMLGQRTVHRWVLLVVMSAIAHDTPVELLTIGGVRGRSCEILQDEQDPRWRLDALVLGMFSILGPGGIVPEDLLTELPVSSDVRRALRGEPGRFRDLLETVMAAEIADWDAAVTSGRRLGFDTQQLIEAHREALEWSTAVRAIAEGAAPAPAGSGRTTSR